MVPQNQTRQVQQSMSPSFMPANSVFDPSPYFNSLDPTQAAKQMAALTAASQARIANSRPSSLLNSSSGTNSAPFLGGTTTTNYPSTGLDSLPGSTTHTGLPNMQNSHGANSVIIDTSMSQPNIARNQPQPTTPLKQRQQGFLNGLAHVMAKQRNTPLPPALTGVTTLNYDPNTSPFKAVESSEVGSFRLAGKDIDLFKLWGVVIQSGGGPVVSSNNGWGAVASQFGLPDEITQPGGASIPGAQAISQYYFMLLLPFESFYRQNIQEQQKRAQATTRPSVFQHSPLHQNQNQSPQAISSISQPMQLRGVTGGTTGSANQISGSHVPTTTSGALQALPQAPQRPGSAALSQAINITPYGMTGTLLDDMTNGHINEGNVLDQEFQGNKRKMDFDQGDKRVRQKTGSEPPENTPSAATDRSSATTNSTSVVQTTSTTIPRIRQQPSRRKIEYVPLAREVETHGGRDLRSLENEMATSLQRRPLRDINDWGTVDVEALTMSIRSRLSTELSYALTTFTLLSTMRGQTPGSGFPIFQAADLLDEVLDLLEDQAFGNVEDSTDASLLQDFYVTTNRALVNMVTESQDRSFAILELRQGSKNPDLGPRQRPGNIILTVLNIIRNLSTIPDNLDFISRHTRLVDVMLRLCAMSQERLPTPTSPALSLGDLVIVRKDTLYTLTNIAGNIHLANAASSTTFRMASRAFQLISSYLIDPVEAVSPLACMQLTGIPSNGNFKPPLLADIALDVLTRLSQSDSNRQVFAKVVPPASILRLFEALVHRLPIVDADFQLVAREAWLSYLEKTVMAIYSLAFLAPPAMKQKVKADRTLAFKSVMLRMIQKFVVGPSNEGRGVFGVCTKRAIEAMKVLDDAEDSFDTSKSTVPIMSFGMGYGEIGDNGAERGTGLLGGHRDVAWDMLMMREIYADPVMFGELESLVRVEC